MTEGRITFLLFTNNEEKRVEEMLRCLSGHGEIILVDNFSNDRTISIAKKYTKLIYQHKNIGYVENEETINFALNLASNEWVYLAYADELIPKKLMHIIKTIAYDSHYDVVEIYRKNFMYGQEVFNYGKHHLRMFKKGTVDFHNNIVHKLGIYRAGTKVFRVRKSDYTSIWHFSSYNCDKLELVHNRYANIEATQRSQILKQKFSGLRTLYIFWLYFFGTYFGLGGFRGGWPGLFISIQIAYYKFSIEARLWELDFNINEINMNCYYKKLKNKLIEF